MSESKKFQDVRKRVIDELGEHTERIINLMSDAALTVTANGFVPVCVVCYDPTDSKKVPIIEICEGSEDGPNRQRLAATLSRAALSVAASLASQPNNPQPAEQQAVKPQPSGKQVH